MPSAEIDPLSFALRPPPGETNEARQQRLKNEAEAKIRSNRIDELLRAERDALKRKRGTDADVKLLLLGQAHSGKSTLTKQFQLLYAPETLESQRSSWKPVVYLNVLHAVRQILDTLDEDEDSAYMSDKSNGDYRRSQKSELYQRQIYSLRLRLAPLLSVEETLTRSLASAGHGLSSPSQGPLVRPGWASRSNSTSEFTEDIIDDRDPYGPTAMGVNNDAVVAHLFFESAEHVDELWTHPAVRTLVKRRKLRLEDSREFFLGEIGRIASPYYLPTTDDILRCRLQTLGVAEYDFPMNVGRKAVMWRLFDVGGSRGQRHTWVPFFEDANAIIFLAPISAFDQYLEEDYKINRIDDSLQTFTSICANPLLKNVHLVLFLNKIDILRQKLAAGVKVKKYITSFANRPNEYDEVTAYFKAHFMQVHRKNNVDQRRALYTHMTSVVDTKATQSIITNVRDSIFRGYLRDTSLV
ncbi:related to guanine nucleotide-binding protein alpha-4 subunit [Serendipita indica DSM 11827]|uniref:Related to guanine nucleotide-binding protein alpha-4 subunit n=1 Tax=Serendipita indica (strain DSM 11827) TaxID=1109443 RepID=G4TJ27_SERID|nr:related to guanine nucleotide-binding protein alpha-4 subunit [Serendipita indica DSM 11827]